MSTRKIFQCFLAVGAAVLFLAVKPASGQTFTSLYSFPPEVYESVPNVGYTNSTGVTPSGLTLGNDGNFYGITFSGGPNGAGTIFKMTTSGVFTITNLVNYSIYSPNFDVANGAQPAAPLTRGSDGNFYGTTETGGITNSSYLNGGNGMGTVFQITPSGALTILASFGYTNGFSPAAALIQGNDGNLYGVTRNGGYTNSSFPTGMGTIFEVATNASGSLTTLFSFTGTNGALPNGLTLGNDGNFYGITFSGGITNSLFPKGMGTVFRVTTNGSNGNLTTLLSFANTNGAVPETALTLGNDGNFYGATFYGGYTNLNSGKGYGTVFKMATNGNLTTLFSFANTNGAYPEGTPLIQYDGNFYGMTVEGGVLNDGTIFKMTPSGTLITLFSFNFANGASPNVLTLGNDGNFYGTTQGGGTNPRYSGDSTYAGTVFKLTMPTPSAIGITMFSNLPVIIWPASATNLVLQGTTNLASPNWVDVSGGIPFSGIMVTNAAGAAFFRLH